MYIERGKVNCIKCECNDFCPRINLLSEEERENIQSCSDSENFDDEDLEVTNEHQKLNSKQNFWR